MNYLKSSWALCLVFFFLIQSLQAQNPSYTIKGKIVESLGKSPIEFATVLLLEGES